MKFKEGDRVVVIAVSDYPSVYPVGKEFIIGHVNIYNSEIVYEIPAGTFVLTEHIEFAHIYNSPLYESLK